MGVDVVAAPPPPAPADEPLQVHLQRIATAAHHGLTVEVREYKSEDAPFAGEDVVEVNMLLEGREMNVALFCSDGHAVHNKQHAELVLRLVLSLLVPMLQSPPPAVEQ